VIPLQHSSVAKPNKSSDNGTILGRGVPSELLHLQKRLGFHRKICSFHSDGLNHCTNEEQLLHKKTRHPPIRAQEPPGQRAGHINGPQNPQQLQWRHPHRLLHGWCGYCCLITILIEVGHVLSVVQHFVGHKYSRSTEKSKQSDVEALQRAIDKHYSMG